MTVAPSRRVIVCGSRDWNDREAIRERLRRLGGYMLIVHGAAAGADTIAADEAAAAGMLTEPHPADWNRLGKRAGLIRNERMAALGADLLIAFWDGHSTGTAHMIDRAKAHGIPVEIVTAT